jgi:hypothetical protein
MQRKLSKHISLGWVYLAAFIFIAGCSKPDPVTPPDPPPPPPVIEQPPVDLAPPGGDCQLLKISQKNNSSGADDNVYEIQKAGIQANPTGIVYTDNLKSKNNYSLTIRTAGDTLSLSTGEYFLINPGTKLVRYFVTRSDLSDPLSDKQVWEYVYNANGYLVKKYGYINNAATPLYESNYTYDNNNLLTGCTMYVGSKRDRLLQTTFTYDMSSAIKSWIYLFPDFFEGYRYLQAMPFGKKGVYPVKSITTTVYDVSNGSILDTWATNFSGYTFSKDGFVLQTTAKGDLQQGLGLLYGATKFDYQCSK